MIGGEPPKCIFVVEDEFLLALSLVNDLRSAGYDVVGPYRSLSEAIEAEQKEQFDGAILDVNLKGEFVYPLAERLAKAAKPFVFLTGYNAADLPPHLRSIMRIAKPYDPEILLRQLRRLLSKA